MGPVIFQAPVQFLGLCLCERNGMRNSRDAVPNILNKLDPLWNAEFQNICQ